MCFLLIFVFLIQFISLSNKFKIMSICEKQKNYKNYIMGLTCCQTANNVEL